MKKCDNEFFEAFKRLEARCGEIYSCTSGVSAYIGDMEKNAEAGRRRVADYDARYKTLKHLRWVRNQIAHAASEDAVSTAEDLDALKAFTADLLAGRDPISLTKKAAKRAAGTSSAGSRSASSGTASRGTASKGSTTSVKSGKKKKKDYTGWVIAAEVLLLAVGLFVLFRMIGLF